jgi:hypothetical protein
MIFFMAAFPPSVPAIFCYKFCQLKDHSNKQKMSSTQVGLQLQPISTLLLKYTKNQFNNLRL